MRIHCLENVDKALQFLRDQRVHLENMGSHDIVDGSSRLTLGLIWTIILRFQVPILALAALIRVIIIIINNKKTKEGKKVVYGGHQGWFMPIKVLKWLGLYYVWKCTFTVRMGLKARFRRWDDSLSIGDNYTIVNQMIEDVYEGQ